MSMEHVSPPQQGIQEPMVQLKVQGSSMLKQSVHRLGPDPSTKTEHTVKGQHAPNRFPQGWRASMQVGAGVTPQSQVQLFTQFTMMGS